MTNDRISLTARVGFAKQRIKNIRPSHWLVDSGIYTYKTSFIGQTFCFVVWLFWNEINPLISLKNCTIRKVEKKNLQTPIIYYRLSLILKNASYIYNYLFPNLNSQVRIWSHLQKFRRIHNVRNLLNLQISLC